MSLLDDLQRCGAIRAVDHALAASLRRLDPQTPDVVLAAAALTASAVARGHSTLPLARAGELLPTPDDDVSVPALPPLDAWRDALRTSRWVATSADDAVDERILVLEHDRLSLRRYWRYERRLAHALIGARVDTRGDAADAAWQDIRLHALFPALATEPSDAQAAAARAALSHRVVLLTGGPGTGKTTTVARLLVLAVDAASRRNETLRILLAAPTGKAAARLGESLRATLDALVRDGVVDDASAGAIPTTAATVHRLLGTIPNRSNFHHDATHPLAADLVIVDEASMVDLPLMTKLVEAVPPGARLVLIGDPDQLPSVETGNVLAALCEAADHTAEARFPGVRVHLTRSHRQAAQLDLAPLATAIREGDADTALDGLEQSRFGNVDWERGHPRALPAWLRTYALPHYRALQTAASPDHALAHALHFRVLTALREGPSGSVTLNTSIAAALDPTRRGDALFHGGLVMVVQNSYRHGLFNGDIGIVWRDAEAPERLHVWFATDTGLRAFAPAALPAHEPAFALTVHKSQGSEFDRVLLVLPDHATRAVSRELLYTGLTRTREHLTLWASEAVLRDGIARRAQRYSNLALRFPR